MTVTGSPFNTNFFKITGPGLGLTGVSTNQFIVTGKLSTAPQASNVFVSKATYTRPLIGPAQAQVFASSKTTSQLAVSSYGSAVSPLAGSVRMQQIINGLTPTADFFVNANLFEDLAGNLSRTIIVTDTTLSPPFNALSASLVDRVNITSATYNQATSTLTVTASSSDQLTPLTLAVLELPAPGNALVNGTFTAVLSAPPDQVTVQSSQGGVATAEVILVGPGSTSFLIPDFAPPVANAGADQTVFASSLVNLTAAASTGVIADYFWTQTAGPAVGLSNATTATPQFIYPSVIVPTLTFQLTTIGPGGTSIDTVNILGATIPPVIPTVTSAQVKGATAATQEWRVQGTVNTIVPGSTITKLIVTDSLGNTADLIARSGGAPLAIDIAGAWRFSRKGSNLTTGLASGQWRIHAVSSTGTVGPQFVVTVQ